MRQARELEIERGKWEVERDVWRDFTSWRAGKDFDVVFSKLSEVPADISSLPRETQWAIRGTVDHFNRLSYLISSGLIDRDLAYHEYGWYIVIGWLKLREHVEAQQSAGKVTYGMYFSKLGKEWAEYPVPARPP